MFNEIDYIDRLERVDAEDLSLMLLRPSEREEQVLRKHLSDSLFQRLHSIAIRREMTHGSRDVQIKGNVIIIPGMLGSQLTSQDASGKFEHIWISPRHIVDGHLGRLRLDESGRSEADPEFRVSATGVLKRYYGELMLSLAEHWNVRTFCYDWRKDFKIIAAELHAVISQFPEREPVHIVAHSTGGLVAHWYIKQFSERWNASGKDKLPARLIMLGTPNYGLFSAPLALTGQLALIRWVDMLDAKHDHKSFRTIVNSFPSLYQLIPAPQKIRKGLQEKLYDPRTYGVDSAISQLHLRNAQIDHAELAKTLDVADPTRMVYIAGDNQPTFVDIHDPNHLTELTGEVSPHELFIAPNRLNGRRNHPASKNVIHQVFVVGTAGDGSSAHKLCVLKNAPTLYIEESHANLKSHPGVLAAIDRLLQVDLDQATLDRVAYSHGLYRDDSEKRQHKQLKKQEAEARLTQSWKNDLEQLESMVRRVYFRGSNPPTRLQVNEDEQPIRDLLVRGFLTGRQQRRNSLAFDIPVDQPKITISVLHGDITKTDEIYADQPAIEAIALGHYYGSKPMGMMRNLDKEISSYFSDQPQSAGADNNQTGEDQLILSQYTQRGVIRGELGQPFFMQDPRPNRVGRVIVIAGMGIPGRFNEPELMMLVRELCWSLGRMGKRHLATALIGSGRDHLSISTVVTGWVRGIKHALTGAEHPLSHITFVSDDAQKVLDFDTFIRHHQEALTHEKRMTIIYDPLTEKDKVKLEEHAREAMIKKVLRGKQSNNDAGELSTRITVSMTGNKYRFGAITNTASIPERDLYLDPKLVKQANQMLVEEGDLARQLEWGKFMEKLLIPEDLRGQLYANNPLVMMLDPTSARIHWELLAHSEPVAGAPISSNSADIKHDFWGTSRGFTRQLRTTFAAPPDPPAPIARLLRVLVVADPAADAPLVGAQEEGIYVADLFERFNSLYCDSRNRVEVVRLFGPREATRTTVLRHLMMRTYDVLHFCGHCIYDEEDSSASGWIFSDKERLSAYEFTRIDRIPKFVFSNACDSGITSEGLNKWSIDLAPSLAEAFFERGVSNFVCTAWPVDDRAARDFALTLYASLLGMYSQNGNLIDINSYQKLPVCKMHEAMKNARLAIAEPPNDMHTWGAYQHYGNPYFRLMNPFSMGEAHDQTSRTAYSLPVNESVSESSNKQASSPHKDVKDKIEIEDKVYFNGINGRTGRPARDPLSLEEIAALINNEEPSESLPPRRAQTRGLSSSLLSDIDKIAKVGWALVTHENEKSEVLDALEPLFQHRLNQAGNSKLIKKLTYRTNEQLLAWLDRHKVAPGSINPAKVPFYLLVIGDPTQIPMSFGHLLDLQYAVGRLAFATVQEYKNYAESVIRYESGEVQNAKEAVFFATRHDGDPVTRYSADQLVKPLLSRTPEGELMIPSLEQFNVRQLLNEGATKKALQQVLSQSNPVVIPPALFCSATHGVGWDKGDPLQLAAQGALLCQEWEVGDEETAKAYFAASDVSDDANIHGLIAFLFACHSIGTPSHDRYFHRKRMPVQIAEQPFFAALPQRLLGHPKGGALACIGHIDRVTHQSFLPGLSEPRLESFIELISTILTGKPVGLALTDFNDRFATLSSELTRQFEDGANVFDPQLADEWLLRNDAEGYVLFGDPAVRLAVESLKHN